MYAKCTMTNQQITWMALHSFALHHDVQIS